MEYTLNVKYDEYPSSIEELYGDYFVGKIISCTRHLQGDTQVNSKRQFNDVVKNIKNKIHLPIYCYVHSGVTISTTEFTCPWDSFFAGYIVLDRERFLKNMGYKRMSKKRSIEAYNQLEEEIRIRNSYISGEVYCFEITDSNGDMVEFCGGFLCEDACRSEGQDFLSSLNQK